MDIRELRELVGEVLAEDKRAKKQDKAKVSRVGDAMPEGFAYAEALDFMRPLGADNRLHLQGQAPWGPLTGMGLSMNMDDNIVLNKNIFRFDESAGRSPWDLLKEAGDPEPVGVPIPDPNFNLWESVLRWYDFQKKGLGLDEAAPVRSSGEEALIGHLPEKHIGFKKLAHHFARQKNIKDPDALAASIGRKKYGANGMAKKAAAGHK